MDALTILRARRAAWETAHLALTAQATTVARTPARSIRERDAQFQRLQDYDEQRHELRAKITCVDELISAIVAATPVADTPLAPATPVAASSGVVSSAA